MDKKKKSDTAQTPQKHTGEKKGKSFCVTAKNRRTFVFYVWAFFIFNKRNISINILLYFTPQHLDKYIQTFFS